jgi:hypothetical protein
MGKAHWLLLTAVVLLSACHGVHHASILDVRLSVGVDSLRVAPRRLQDVPARRDRTIVQFHVTISNPVDRQLWANDCHARAYDDQEGLLYSFTFNPSLPAGAYIGPKGAFQGMVQASAPTSAKVAQGTARVMAECAAWDWGDSPPI